VAAADAGSGDGASEDAAPHDAGVAVVDGGALSDAGKDSGDAGCSAFQVHALADTNLLMDGGYCNGPITFGAALSLRVQGAPAPELAIARFSMPAVQAAKLDHSASVVISTSSNSTCSVAPCSGSVYAMRSDWTEGAGGPQGADACRRDDVSGAWGSGGLPMSPLGQPFDYDMGRLAPMTFAAGSWVSTPFAGDAFGSRLGMGTAADVQVSVLFSLPVGTVAFPAREANGGGVTMSVTRCQ
jgi:hypothetical protein